jgi:hypothetical protein
MAAAASPTTAPVQITTANKPGALIRLLLVQDQAKAFAYIAQAEADGIITADQAVKIRDFWTAHHKQFAWNFVLRRLLRAQDESNVKAYLDKAVINSKITVDQENKYWRFGKFYMPLLRPQLFHLRQPPRLRKNI